MSNKKSQILQTSTLTVKRAIANGIRNVEKMSNSESPNSTRKAIKSYPEGSTQDFIPIESIKNGIVKLTDGRYIGIIEVYPINFMKLASNEKNMIVYNWQKLYEGGLQKIQIKAMCDFFNPEKLIKNIQKESKKYNDPSILEARDNYIRHILHYSNAEAISTRYFIIYQYAGDIEGNISKDFTEICLQMEETENFIRDICKNCGNITYNPGEIKEKNRAVTEFLYYFFNRNTSRKESLESRATRIKNDFKAFTEATGIKKDYNIRDLIASKGIRFTNHTFAYMDGMYYSYLGILPNSYPEAVYGGWIDQLFNYLQFTDIDIISYKYAKEFTQMSLTGINKVTESNYNRQIYKHRKEKAEKAALKYGNNTYVQKHMSDLHEELWKTAIILTVKAPSERVLVRAVNFIKKGLEKFHVKVEDSFDRTEDYFTLTMPLLCCAPSFNKIRHDTLSSQMGSMYCFTCYELYDPLGYMLGENMDTKAITCPNNFNTERYKNGNTVLIGTSGAGKTFIEEVIGTRSFLNGMRVFSIIPAKGWEYEPGCKMVGGTFIKYYPGSKDCLNPLEIRPIGEFDKTVFGNGDDEDLTSQESSLLARKVTFLIIWLQMQSNSNDIDTVVFSKLQEVIPKIYEKKGITEDNASIYEEDGKTLKEMPILSDMYNEFKKYRELEEYTSIVSGLINGPFKNLNGQTNVDMSKGYIVFDVDERKIGKKLISACQYAVFDFTNTAVLENPLSKDIVILDEAWKMLKLPACAEQVKDMIKLIRGYGGCVIIATQELNDFINNSNGYGISVLSNSEIKIILNLKEEELKMVKSHMKLSEDECRKIEKFKKGEAFFISGSDRVRVSVAATDVEMYTFTTDINVRRKMAEKKSFNVNRINI